MWKNIKPCIEEVIKVIDKELNTQSSTFRDKINNYNSCSHNLEEAFRQRVKRIKKELPLLQERYAASLFTKSSEGKNYRGENPREIKEKIKNYQEETDPEVIRVFNMLLEGFREYIRHEGSDKEEVNFDFTLFDGRPPVKIQWGQTICTEETCLKRVKLILRDFTRPDTKVLFIGDDDLNSLVLRSISGFDVYMMDIDDRLLEFIDSKGMNIHTMKVDLLKGVPEHLTDYFDVVAMNPYWDYEWIKTFLQAASKCLRKNKDSRLYVTFPPLGLSGKQYGQLQKDILNMGLLFREIIPFFDWYDMSDKALHEDISRLVKIMDRIRQDLKAPLMEKLIQIPASSAHMYVLSIY